MLDSMVGPYRIVRLLGEGGMGAVYEAMNDAMGRRVAIKVLHAAFARHKETTSRFFNEARAVNFIEHPSLVQVYECGYKPDGTAYLVMEFLNGETLAQRLKRVGGRLSWSEALPLVWQVAAALAAVHAKGIIHRDLKPANLMLVPDPLVPRGERIKVLDFGIAKLAGVGTSVATVSQAVMGTPAYMSPEQCRGAAAVDGKADVYALGCVLFELLVGRPPFCAEEGASILVVLNMHQSEPCPALVTLVADLPPEADALVQRLLAKAREDRPTMYMLAVELAALAGITSAPALMPAPPAASAAGMQSLAFARTMASQPPITRERRRRLMGAVGLGLLGMSLLSWLVMPWLSSRLRRPAPLLKSNSAAVGAAAAAKLPQAFPCRAAFPLASTEVTCPGAFIPWCEPHGQKIACCAAGLVPHSQDGSCGCPPGGALPSQPAALLAGCLPAGTTAKSSRQRIEPTINQNILSLIGCLQSALAANQELQGGVLLKLLLAPDGTVFHSQVEASSIPSLSAQQCLTALFQRIHFPPPPGGSDEVTYPINLLH